MLSMMERMFKEQGEEWDQLPEFGFLHAPPLKMVASVAEMSGADLAEVRGMVAIPMPMAPEAWEMAGDPEVLVAAYADALAAPENDHEKGLVRSLRETAPVMGTWMITEAWAPPERMNDGEYSRSREAGQPIDLSALPDRREARVGWMADAWGRDYMARQIRGSDEFEYDYTEPGGHNLSRHHSMIKHLRKLMEAVAAPLPIV
jgi:hypothetical protein